MRLKAFGPDNWPNQRGKVTLDGVDFETIHECWSKAFSDYQVPFQFSKEALKIRLNQVSFQPSLSFGVFDKREMVGFWLSGLREVEGRRVGYGAGTAFYPRFRGVGLGKRLYGDLEKLLIERRVSTYVLEVFCNNDHAIALYEKRGFVITRKYLCYRAECLDEQLPVNLAGCLVTRRNLAELSCGYTNMLDYSPSWQNEMEAMLNVKESIIALTVDRGAQALGYGIIQPVSRRIAQIGIVNVPDSDQIFALLVKNLYEQLGGKGWIEIVNIQEGISRVPDMLKKMGFTLFVELYEMKKEIYLSINDAPRMTEQSSSAGKA